ncbi:MAG: plasmid pRiA4b ORF-3 family protein [Gammaproteobacteria bacterium]|nr:plasmid pRiA4b ORF-3 family protein [Gammaproteobacteria bacterium]
MSSSSNIVHLRQSYQIKVALSHIKPPVWRRLIVDSRISLDVLHDVLQISMGWTNSHMHQFIDREGVIYGQSYDDEFMPSLGSQTIEESAVLLNEVLKKEKDWLKYEYDFGDGWEHKITLEKILPHKKNQFPIACIKGKRACPPEDCGGPWGYAHMLEQLAAPEDDEEHAELLEWLGDDFEPESFDLEETNEILQEIFDGALFNAKAGLENELQRIESDHELFVEAPGLAGFDEMRSDLASATNDLLNDPDVPSELKQLVGGMQEVVEVVNYMDDMIEQSVAAFEKIRHISKDKKIVTIAEEMLKVLDVD